VAFAMQLHVPQWGSLPLAQAGVKRLQHMFLWSLHATKNTLTIMFAERYI